MLVTQKIFSVYKIAIIEAIASFGDKEGNFSKEIAQCYNQYCKCNTIRRKEIIIEYEHYFKHFIGIFGIQRGLPVIERYNLIEFILEEYLKELNKAYTPGNIEKYAKIAKSNGYTRGLQISCFSKIAFIFKPSIYFPYDSRARSTLNSYINEKKLYLNIERNYINYMKVVDMISNELLKEYNFFPLIKSKDYIKELRINRKKFDNRYNNFLENCDILAIDDIDRFILRRALDKSLMIIGGFNFNNLAAVKEGILESLDK